MTRFVTILSIPYPQQVYIIKARLESEGIECFTKNELTIQTDPLLSNAVGGIQLQVKEEDVNAATKVLEEEGYLNKGDVDANPYEGLETFANKLPLFKGMRFELKLVSWIVILIVIVYFFIYFIKLSNHS